MSKDMGRRIRKVAFWLLVAALSWCVILGAIIWKYGANDRVVKSDCIIILGAAVHGGVNPSPVFEERIRHGIELYRAGQAQKLVFTGGIGAGQTHSEGSVGRSIAIQHGIPGDDIFFEDKSQTTKQNLSEAMVVMKRHGMTSAIIVSDPLHMKRAMLMAGGLGMKAVSSPTPTSRYRSFGPKLRFILREVYFIQHYAVTGE